MIVGGKLELITSTTNLYCERVITIWKHLKFVACFQSQRKTISPEHSITTISISPFLLKRNRSNSEEKLSLEKHSPLREKPQHVLHVRFFFCFSHSIRVQRNPILLCSTESCNICSIDWITSPQHFKAKPRWFLPLLVWVMIWWKMLGKCSLKVSV